MSGVLPGTDRQDGEEEHAADSGSGTNRKSPPETPLPALSIGDAGDLEPLIPNTSCPVENCNKSKDKTLYFSITTETS